MNYLKSLSTWLWKNQGPLIEVQGTFFDFYKNEWRCLFNNCKVTLRRGSEQFEFFLTVERLEGDDAEADEEDAKKFDFPIDAKFSMRRESSEFGAAYSWVDANNVSGSQNLTKAFLLELDESVNQSTINLFETTVCKCQWEASQKQAFPDDGDLDELTERHLKAAAQPAVAAPPKQSSSRKSNVTKSPSPTPSPPTSPTPSHWAGCPPSPLRISSDQIGSSLFQAKGFVSAYQELGNDTKKEPTFQTAVIVSLAIREKTSKGFTYDLHLKSEAGEVLFSQQVSNDMFMQSFVDGINWVSTEDTGSSTITWSFFVKFDNKEDLTKFKYMFGKCLWESSKKASFSLVNDNDADWVLSTAIDNLDLRDSKDDDDDEPDDFDFSISVPSTTSKSSQTNSALAVGFTKSDRSFVAHGPSVSVFKDDDEGKVQLVTSMNVKTPSGLNFNPKKIMLHQQDNNMLLLNPNAVNSVYKVDLNRPDIVEEWKTGSGYPIKQIIGETKYAQLEPTETVLAYHERGIFRIDPRLKGDKQAQSLSYNTKSCSFNCGATTAKGQLAVGSKDGQIRLYRDDILNRDSLRAQTSLPGLGDPIIGIDVTASGDFILATCKTYLLLIPATIAGTDVTGFDKPMGKEKPMPKRLQLQPEHIALIGNISFTPAHFNISEQGETSIVTSTGRFVISWSLQKVKQDKLNSYKIRNYGEEVVANEFKFNDQAIVAITTHNLNLAKHKKV